MSFEQHETAFACPYCGETISMLLDLSVPGQTYVEDCEVCCRPIEVSYGTADGELTDVSVARLDGL